MKTRVNLAVIFTLSVIPDCDILTEGLRIPYLRHRGPMHSVIVAFILFIPLLVIYRRKAVPYFLALIQHTLFGDYLTGGSEMLWPITSQQFGLNMSIMGLPNIALEWLLFLASIIVMMRTGDIVKFFQFHPSNLFLLVPTVTVLLPTVLSFPLRVPVWLLLPHLGYVFLFSAAIIMTFSSLLRRVFTS